MALARVAAAVRQAATDRHQSVVAAALPELIGEGDPLRLERLLMNLVANAVKYSREGGTVPPEPPR